MSGYTEFIYDVNISILMACSFFIGSHNVISLEMDIEPMTRIVAGSCFGGRESVAALNNRKHSSDYSSSYPEYEDQ
jgi:hypothetical protein